MTSELAPIDVAIVVAYMLGTILLGLWLSRQQKSLRTFFVGDRDVSWWLVLVSIVATETSTVTFLSVPGVAFAGNLTFLQLAFGYIVGRVLIAWLLVPQYLRGELYSAYQLLHQRFNRAVQRTASGIFLATRILADGLRLYLAGLLLQLFTGWDGQWSVLAIGTATIVYTYLGGMQAVIWTDLVQFVIYLGGEFVAAGCILHQVPGGLDGYLAAGELYHKFTLLDTSPDPRLPLTIWAGLIGGAFFTMASHGADQMMVQRYLCSRSLGQARLALVLSGVVVLLQFLLFLLIGVGLYVLFRQGSLPVDPGTRNDEVFGIFIVHFLPHGLVGLVIASVLAASMSTLSSSINSAASATVTDFYRPLRPERGDAHYLFVSRLMTLFWGASRIVVALVALNVQSDRSVVEQVLKVAGFTTGMILGLFLLGSMSRPVQSGSALVGLVAGFAAVTAVWLPSVWGKDVVAWPWYAPTGTLVTVVIARIVDRMSVRNGSFAHGGPQPGLDQPG